MDGIHRLCAAGTIHSTTDIFFLPGVSLRPTRKRFRPCLPVSRQVCRQATCLPDRQALGSYGAVRL